MNTRPAISRDKCYAIRVACQEQERPATHRLLSAQRSVAGAAASIKRMLIWHVGIAPGRFVRQHRIPCIAMPIEGPTALLQVFDMPASLRLHRDVLGFAVEMKSHATADESDWIMLKLDDSSLMLNTAYERGARPATADPARVAAHRDTGLFFGCDSADAVYAHLRDHGVPARQPTTTRYGMRQVYVTDPDGYELCFQHPFER
jgi:catechol 2,3-dioxygenase-like lactoylglutathione lyase family enzyme